MATNEAEIAGDVAAANLASSWAKPDPLFRFVQARAPQLPRARGIKLRPRIRAYFPAESTELHARLGSARAAGGRNEALQAAAEFIGDIDRQNWGGVPWFAARGDMPSWLVAIDDALHDTGTTDDIAAVDQALREAVAADGTLISDGRLDLDDFQGRINETWRGIADSIMAACLHPLVSAQTQADLSRAITVVALLNEWLEAGWAPGASTAGMRRKLSEVTKIARIHEVELELLILLPPDVFPLARAPLPGAETGERETHLSYAGPRAPRLAAAAARVKPAPVQPPERERYRRAMDEAAKVMRRAATDEMPKTIGEILPHLSGEAAERVTSLGIARDASVFDALRALDDAAAAAPGLPLAEALAAPTAALQVLGRNDTLRSQAQAFTVINWELLNLTRAPIVGDLKIVQQELLRYEAGEIAHIENVMATEERARLHEFKTLREEEVLTVTERQEDRTFDNQTTTRQEVERESTKQSQSQFSLEAGVTFSAQYGPVKIGANTSAAYSTSSAESNRQASKFAKDVVERSVEQIRQRNLEQRRTLTRTELLDSNKHGFNNQSDEHVVGIYQWVDKVYEAATFNYGLRMMLDLTIAQPAAYWEYARALATAASVNAQPPPPLKVIPSQGAAPRDLVAIDIDTVVKLEDLAKTFRVAGLKPPPPRWVTASVEIVPEGDPPADKAPGEQPSVMAKKATLRIPKGYVPRRYTAVVTLLFNPREAANKNSQRGGAAGAPTELALYQQELGAAPPLVYYSGYVMGQNVLTVGPIEHVITPGRADRFGHSFSEAGVGGMDPIGTATNQVGEEGSLPVTLTVVGSPTYAAAVTVICERTPASYRAWQLEQFEAVVSQWENWNQEFEAAVREARTASSIGRMPVTALSDAVRESLIGTEIRRMFLQMLGVPFIGLGAGFTPADLMTDPTNPQPPKVHPPIAAFTGRTIQFVEQAFEWPQVTYHLYPYYWRRESEWPSAIANDATDLQLAAFLKAGSARVVVPVRPGFELAVCNYLGIDPPLPWQAGIPPIVDTNPYLAIADEIKSAETSLTTPVRVDTPWIVRVPTTLVKLKADAELPVYRQPTV